jgi:hypothetical protein
MGLFTEVERVEVWDRRQAGEGNRSIGRRHLDIRESLCAVGRASSAVAGRLSGPLALLGSAGLNDTLNTAVWRS